MLSTMKAKSRVWIAIVPVLLVILAVALVLLFSFSGLLKRGPAARIPVTGDSLSSGSSISSIGMSQRSMDAYSARLYAMAGEPAGMTRRATNAYSARMNGQAGVMSQRAQGAYSERMEASGVYYQALTEK